MQDEERTRLLLDMEHILKAPLLAALRRSDASLKRAEPTRDDILVIRALCAKMWSQLSTFRVFSRLASDQSLSANASQLTIVDLTTILENAVRDARSLDRPTDSHPFEVTVDLDSPALVQVDVNLFDMALREVIENGVKYSYHNGRIKARIHESSKGKCAISITNESTPVSPEEIRRLLERGYRSADARLRTSEGAGIGLFLVKVAMDAQNGCVTLQSHGQQMSVTLELPTVTSTMVTT